MGQRTDQLTKRLKADRKANDEANSAYVEAERTLTEVEAREAREAARTAAR